MTDAYPTFEALQSQENVYPSATFDLVAGELKYQHQVL